MARRKLPDPLPVRDGLNPLRVYLEAGTGIENVGDYLLARFEGENEHLELNFRAGLIVDQRGNKLSWQSPVRSGSLVFLYRPERAEVELPFDPSVIYEDERIVVVEKPHFLPTTPRGQFVKQTALIKLRKALDQPELSPSHRLDRLTAGLLVFTKKREYRHVYHDLFARRQVVKTYQAVAPYRAGLSDWVSVHSRIQKVSGIMQASEIPGPVNATSQIRCVAKWETTTADRNRMYKKYHHEQTLGSYELKPLTGKTHQLRLHMTRLGVSIVNDNYYPNVFDIDVLEFGKPLQLLAKTLAFTDPISGKHHHFVSRQELSLHP